MLTDAMMEREGILQNNNQDTLSAVTSPASGWMGGDRHVFRFRWGATYQQLCFEVDRSMSGRANLSALYCM